MQSVFRNFKLSKLFAYLNLFFKNNLHQNKAKSNKYFNGLFFEIDP